MVEDRKTFEYSKVKKISLTPEEGPLTPGSFKYRRIGPVRGNLEVGMPTPPPPPPSWLPTNEADILAFWFRSDLGTVKDGADRISQRQDQGTHLRHLNQVMDAKKPVHTANEFGSYPGDIYDGIDDVLKTDLFTFTQPYQIFMVYKIITLSPGYKYVFDGANGPDTMVFAHKEASPSIVIYAGTILTCPIDLSAGNKVLASCKFNGASSEIIVNGVGATGNLGAAVGMGLVMGNSQHEIQPTNISVADIFGFSPLPSAGVVANAINYLNTRYEVY